jgi:hypothetical protein
VRSTDTANRFQALRQLDTSSKAFYLARMPVGMPGFQVCGLRLPETDDLSRLAGCTQNTHHWAWTRKRQVRVVRCKRWQIRSVHRVSQASGCRRQASGFREQPNSQAIEDNRFTMGSAKMLADQAQASGSDCTRHRVERGAWRNHTKSKIGGGFFKYAPDEYSREANRLPDADSRLQTTGFREQPVSRLEATGVRLQGNSQTAKRLRTFAQQVFPSASSQCSSAVLWFSQRWSAYPRSLVGFAVRQVGPC